MKILIVDDNPHTAEVVGDLLVDCGVLGSDVSFAVHADIAQIHQALELITPEVLFVKSEALVQDMQSTSWCMEHVLEWFTLSRVPMPFVCCMFLTAGADERLLAGRADGTVTHFMNPTNFKVRYGQVLSFICFCKENIETAA